MSKVETFRHSVKISYTLATTTHSLSEGEAMSSFYVLKTFLSKTGWIFYFSLLSFFLGVSFIIRNDMRNNLYVTSQS